MMFHIREIYPCPMPAQARVGDIFQVTYRDGAAIIFLGLAKSKVHLFICRHASVCVKDSKSQDTIVFDDWALANFVSDEPTTRNLALVGKSGSGKSFIAKSIIEHSIKSGAVVFVLDVTGEYEYERERFDIQNISVKDKPSLGLDPIRDSHPFNIANLLGEFAGLDNDVVYELGTCAERASSMREFLGLVPERHRNEISRLSAQFLNDEPGSKPNIKRGCVFSAPTIGAKQSELFVLFCALDAIWQCAKSIPSETRKVIVIEEGWLFTQYDGIMKLINGMVKRSKTHNVQFVITVTKTDHLISSKLIQYVDEVLVAQGGTGGSPRSWFSMLPTKKEIRTES